MTAGTYFDGSFSVRAHTLRLNVSASEDVVNNTSTVSWSLEVYRHPSYKPYGSDGSWGVNINGSTYGGTFSYNFNSYSYLLLASGSTVVAHNADGTKSISVSGSGYLGSAGGSASTGGTYNLDTIPRATQPTVSPTSGETGATFTIGHVPATSTFTHDVAYSVDNGANYTDIVTGLAGTDPSTDWTPPSTLLPNTTSVTALIRVITMSGATTIGSKTVSLPLTVPASVKPTVSSVSWVDAQTSGPDMPTLMGGAGRFVQRWSKLRPTVTSAGAAGSTVVDSDVTIAGQTTDSGVAFGLPVTLSGAVPFTAVVLDSRARLSDTFASTVPVTAYNFPSLPTPVVTRTSDAAGLIPSPTGTYLAITPSASVSSLNFSGEKNLLEWQIRTRPNGGSWTTKQAWTSATVSGTTWTTKTVIGSYAASSEWEVEVSIRDLFGKNGYDTTNTIKTLTIPIPSEQVFMDWDGANGVGIGKYRQNGKLDVGGDIYDNGLLVAGHYLPAFSKAPTDSASTYPLGTSTMLTDLVSGWPMGTSQYGTLVTHRGYTEPGGTTQYWNAYQGPGLTTGDSMVFYRQWYYQASAWSAWSSATVPTGTISAFAGAAAPVGYLICDGSAVSRTTYATLFALISTTYGAGNGSTTFNLPNLKGRSIFGVDTSQPEFNVRGATGGAKTHTHTLTTAVAAIYAGYWKFRAAVANWTATNSGGVTAPGANSTVGPNSAAIEGSTDAGSTLPPYIALHYIIKT